MGATKGFAELGGSVLSGSGGGDAKFGFNVPLGNTAALRVASYFDRTPGFMEAVQPNLSVKKHVNDGFRSGVRAAVRIAPNDRLSVTPRVMYQRVDANGWNRIGVVNINYNFGNIALTSITSYTYRDVLVVRDATALTASITGGSIGLPPRVYSLDAPLNDATTAKVWTQEVRVAGRTRPWVAGGFFSHTNRDYGQDLPVKGFEDLSGIPTRGLRAPKDSLFFSDLGYTLNQVALFGEGTVSPTDRFSLTGGLRYYHFNEDKQQIFDGIFGND